MSNSILLDVSKGNNLILFILSLPLIALAWIAWLIFCAFALVACLIGRRRAMNALYKTKELM